MAYDQYGNYPQQQRQYYNQAPPRGQGRGGPPPRGQDAYYNQQAGYGQGGYLQGGGRQQSYAGYDDGDILDQYGGDDYGQQGYDRGHQDAGYAQGGYDQYGGQQRPPPQQQRGPPQQRRDDYGAPQQGYGNDWAGGRGRGPPPRDHAPPRAHPQDYPPNQGYGQQRGGPQGYDDRRHPQQYDDRRQQGGQGGTPPRQKPRERLIPPSSPKTLPFDNPFPVFGAQSSPPKAATKSIEQGMSGMDIRGRPSLDKSRPPTSNSQHSQPSRPSYDRQQSGSRSVPAPRSSEDGYGSRGQHPGMPQRSMTMPQEMEYPGNSRPNNQGPNPFPDRGHDVGNYGRGPQDPIAQRSMTSFGDRVGPLQPPQRPSTAGGNRPQANNMYSDQRSNFANGGLPRPPQNFGPPRPGTSQGYREAPRPAQRPAQNIDAYMPDFDAQPGQSRPLKDAIGLPLDAAPEANHATPAQQYAPYDMHKARSQPDLRGQANGYQQNGYTEPVPSIPPGAGGYNGQRRSPPGPLNTNQPQSAQAGYAQMSSPTSPRQFHRPGAPPINRQGTADSGWSDPGPRGGQANKVSANQPPKPMNPDALPAFPTPDRAPSQASRPGAAAIRQEQSKRLSSPRGSTDQGAGPVTVSELARLREAVRMNPQDQTLTFTLAKKLVEASSVLANEGGRADARTTQKNRENYVFEGHKLIKRLVSANNPDAMFYLADCFGTGQLGLPIDAKEAFQLYQGAAKLGHGPSAYRTAVCCEMGHENGGGTRKDPLKAVQWYRRAAALGDTPAMYKLGMILLKGHLAQPPSLGEAMIWLQRAANVADIDNPHALHELAMLYEYAPQGGKVIRDEKYALELYTKAAKFKYRNSQARLGKAYEYGQLGCPVDNRSSIHWYSKAAAQEEHDAELALSGWYLTGSAGILEQSDQEAYLWARKAALAEHPKAEFAMGYFSETGIGCPKSFEDAKRWYGRAAAHRYPKARERLDELMRGGQKGMKNRERISRSDSKKHEDCVVM